MPDTPESQQPGETQSPPPVTIPVNVQIDAHEVVLAQPEMEVLLRDAELIAVGACYCRTTYAHCDRPVDVCITLDATAQKKVEEDGWRPIDVDEALAILEATHRTGLVHLAFRNSNGQAFEVCSCCSCCCEVLGKLKTQSYKTGVVTSAHQATHDASACVQCGVCVDRCQFDAFSRDTDDNTICFDVDHCFGCGVCVSTCPTGAIGFAER